MRPGKCHSSYKSPETLTMRKPISMKMYIEKGIILQDTDPTDPQIDYVVSLSKTEIVHAFLNLFSIIPDPYSMNIQNLTFAWFISHFHQSCVCFIQRITHICLNNCRTQCKPVDNGWFTLSRTLCQASLPADLGQSLSSSCVLSPKLPEHFSYCFLEYKYGAYWVAPSCVSCQLIVIPKVGPRTAIFAYPELRTICIKQNKTVCSKLYSCLSSCRQLIDPTHL